VVITATISASSSNVAAAQALIKFLQGPTIEVALKGNGFER
jgi:ABC-type molybdate transport system substrate-binding protein